MKIRFVRGGGYPWLWIIDESIEEWTNYPNRQSIPTLEDTCAWFAGYIGEEENEHNI